MRQFRRIKGDDKPQNVIRLPRMGKIRLGIKKTTATGKEYPTEVDYFVVPEEVKAKHGEFPKSLPVMLPVEDEDMFMRQYYGVYGGNQKLKCQGDGEHAARRSEDGKKIEEIACPSPEKCEYGQKNKCSARMDIMLVLPEVNCGATYQLSTGSINSDIDIRSGIEMAKHLFGRISWVPMEITRKEKKIPDPKTGNMQTHWTVSLYPNATVAEVNQIRSDTKRILDRQKSFVLDEPLIEGPETDVLLPEESKALPEGESKSEAKAPEVLPKEEPKKSETAAGKSETKGAQNETKASKSETKGHEKDFKFLKSMGEQKKRVGDEAYYKVLGSFGIEHATEVADRKKKVDIFVALDKLPPAGCTGSPKTCSDSQYNAEGKPFCGEGLIKKCPLEEAAN